MYVRKARSVAAMELFSIAPPSRETKNAKREMGVDTLPMPEEEIEGE
jgi:hypothetical protein